MTSPSTMDPETRGWLRLARCPRLSPREAAALGLRLGGAAFAEGAPRGPAVDAVDGATRAALGDAGLGSLLDAEARRVLDGGWAVLHLADPRYPANLAGIAAPPPVVTVQGEVPALAAPAVAIVGSRHPSGYGLRLADELAAGLARVGVVIVSGLAQGIDAAAHRAALAAGGRTVAVMGTGMDRVYPRHHGRLARAIAAQGALVSEFPPGTAPLPHHFPRRNRIIAGLADAVVVVEAKWKSGALITARHGLEFSRPVLAVPGRAGEPLAEGPLGLLRDGAALACKASDVLLELPPDRNPLHLAALGGRADDRTAAAAGPASPPAEGDRTVPPGDGAGSIAGALLRRFPRDDEVPLDALLEGSDHPPDEVLAALFELELAGLVDALPGGCYRRARGGAAGGAV